jgi:5-methylcytosine-specific restriction endonuclease McrA
MVGPDYYNSDEWHLIRSSVLRNWDGFCSMCGEKVDHPIIHHVIPIEAGDKLNLAFNQVKIRQELGCDEETEYLVLCKECHHLITDGLKDPRNRLYKRVCDECGKLILIGFDGDQRVAYELDGARLHYN